MSAQFTPDDWKALIPSKSVDACQPFRLLLKRMQTKYLFNKWAWNSDGTLSPAFAILICDALTRIDCANSSGAATTQSTTSTTTPPPSVQPVWAVTDLNRLLTIDLNTGSYTIKIQLPVKFYGLAQHPTTFELYGVIASGTAYQLVRFNMGNLSYAPVGSATFPDKILGLKFKSDGSFLYGTTGGMSGATVNIPGYLKRIDPATGIANTVGTGLSAFINILAFDVSFASNGTLYGTGRSGTNQNTQLIGIDITNGYTNKLVDIAPVESSPGNECVLWFNSKLYRIKNQTISTIGIATIPYPVTPVINYGVGDGVITNLAHLQ